MKHLTTYMLPGLFILNSGLTLAAPVDQFHCSIEFKGKGTYPSFVSEMDVAAVRQILPKHSFGESIDVTTSEANVSTTFEINGQKLVGAFRIFYSHAIEKSNRSRGTARASQFLCTSLIGGILGSDGSVQGISDEPCSISSTDPFGRDNSQGISDWLPVTLTGEMPNFTDFGNMLSSVASWNGQTGEFKYTCNYIQTLN